MAINDTYISSYAPISTRLAEYISCYSPSAISLYTYLVTKANWNTGPDHGTLEIRVKEMSRGTGLSTPTIRRSLRELARGYPLGILSKNKRKAPSLIEIQTHCGKTRRKRCAIIILRLNKTCVANTPVNATLVELEEEVRTKINGLIDIVSKGINTSQLFGK